MAKFIKDIPRKPREYQMCLVECKCGNQIEVYKSNFKKRPNMVCHDCNMERFKKVNITHGYSKHPLYKKLCGILKRCYDPKEKSYKYYGAKGITVCKEWLDSKASFVEWGLEKGWGKGLEIDRIDGSKGYSPDNCRFVTREVNSRNRTSKNSTGYYGVKASVPRTPTEKVRYYARITYDGKRRNVPGTYPTAKECAIARNNFIIEKKLEHKLNKID